MNPYFDQVNGVIDWLAKNAEYRRRQAAVDRNNLQQQKLETMRYQQERQDKIKSESLNNKLSVLGGWSKNEGMTPEFRQSVNNSILSLLANPETDLSLKPEYSKQDVIIPMEVQDYWSDTPGVGELFKSGGLTKEQADWFTDHYYKSQNVANQTNRANAYSQNLQDKTGMERRRVSAYERNVDSQIKDRETTQPKTQARDTELENMKAWASNLSNERKQLADRLTYKIDKEQRKAAEGRIEEIDGQLQAINDKLSTKSGIDMEPGDVRGLRKSMGAIADQLERLNK